MALTVELICIRNSLAFRRREKGCMARVCGNDPSCTGRVSVTLQVVYTQPRQYKSQLFGN
jgi:hypothetical protein